MLKRYWKLPAVSMLGLVIWIALTKNPIVPLVPTLPILLSIVIGMVVME
jgi:hypothetical protein